MGLRKHKKYGKEINIKEMEEKKIIFIYDINVVVMLSCLILSDSHKKEEQRGYGFLRTLISFIGLVEMKRWSV